MDEEIYLCDPHKNTTCKKSSCFVHGGPCKSTPNPDFAMNDKEMLGDRDITFEQFEELMRLVDTLETMLEAAEQFIHVCSIPTYLYTLRELHKLDEDVIQEHISDYIRDNPNGLHG